MTETDKKLFFMINTNFSSEKGGSVNVSCAKFWDVFTLEDLEIPFFISSTESCMSFWRLRT